MKIASLVLLSCSALAGVRADAVAAFVGGDLERFGHRGCQVADDGDIASHRGLRMRQNVDTSALPDTITVPVHFHIASSEADADLVTDEMVNDQFAVLQSTFAAYSITLLLNSTSRLVDNVTGHGFLINEAASTGGFNFTYDGAAHAAYLRRSHRGGYNALNMHFYSPYQPSATGYCTFPVVNPSADVVAGDACELGSSTMPGIRPDRASPSWNQGHMAVHETGHWFGLNHTFLGACDPNGPGDFVIDTPAHKYTLGCPIGAKTCPGLPGLDPVHNFMGYSDDNCTNEFTPGQKARMFETFFRTRQPSS